MNNLMKKKKKKTNTKTTHINTIVPINYYKLKPKRKRC